MSTARGSSAPDTADPAPLTTEQLARVNTVHAAPVDSAVVDAPDHAAPRHGTPRHDAQDPPIELLDNSELEAATQRWKDIQVAFVDEPQQAVQDADALVAELLQKLAQGFATERQRLESHWTDGDQVSTEDLRVSLQRYRSFFQRLLAV